MCPFVRPFLRPSDCPSGTIGRTTSVEVLRRRLRLRALVVPPAPRAAPGPGGHHPRPPSPSQGRRPWEDRHLQAGGVGGHGAAGNALGDHPGALGRGAFCSVFVSWVLFVVVAGWVLGGVWGQGHLRHVTPLEEPVEGADGGGPGLRHLRDHGGAPEVPSGLRGRVGDALGGCDAPRHGERHLQGLGHARQPVGLGLAAHRRPRDGRSQHLRRLLRQRGGRVGLKSFIFFLGGSSAAFAAPLRFAGGLKRTWSLG